MGPSIRPGTLEKYGDVVCTFVGYYHFLFTFEGKGDDGETIQLSIGGDHDIYYRRVRPGDTITLRDNLHELAHLSIWANDAAYGFQDTTENE